MSHSSAIRLLLGAAIVTSACGFRVNLKDSAESSRSWKDRSNSWGEEAKVLGDKAKDRLGQISDDAQDQIQELREDLQETDSYKNAQEKLAQLSEDAQEKVQELKEAEHYKNAKDKLTEVHTGLSDNTDDIKQKLREVEADVKAKVQPVFDRLQADAHADTVCEEFLNGLQHPRDVTGCRELCKFYYNTNQDISGFAQLECEAVNNPEDRCTNFVNNNMRGVSQALQEECWTNCKNNGGSPPKSGKGVTSMSSLTIDMDSKCTESLGQCVPTTDNTANSALNDCMQAAATKVEGRRGGNPLTALGDNLDDMLEEEKCCVSPAKLLKKVSTAGGKRMSKWKEQEKMLRNTCKFLGLAMKGGFNSLKWKERCLICLAHTSMGHMGLQMNYCRDNSYNVENLYVNVDRTDNMYANVLEDGVTPRPRAPFQHNEYRLRETNQKKWWGGKEMPDTHPDGDKPYRVVVLEKTPADAEPA